LSTHKSLFTLSCLIALATVVLDRQGAYASESTSRSEDPLIAFAQRWDGNRNGIFTCSEWKLFMRRLFRKADRDRDGVVEAKEFPVISGADPILSETSLSYFDSDGDKRIEPDELIDRENPIFLRYDANHDCQVTMPEIMNDKGGSK
jgi:hypothetical protein